ncbi:beta-1,6-N-acetylglucosaminyltransferase [Aestuariibius sp. 2305UL40-4]|uniref:DUF5927 domain-containing protein n=1 Tax=Aestuariibius violaceus TaxID=3234132 RepID=UPI00345F0E55
MTVGLVMLVHTAFDRVEEVARHWHRAGCPIAIHVDKRVPDAEYSALVQDLAALDGVAFSDRFTCEWGRWGLIQGTQSAASLLLDRFPHVSHVYLSSGSCLPLRPIEELQTHLSKRPSTDFIESVTAADVPWPTGGLDEERFTLHFPFSWKRQRRLFDAYVRLQRRLGLTRRRPKGVEPHLGSQWWCLTRQTLAAILNDPKRPTYDRYFKGVWIPDESYFQTLARLHSRDIESRSLTLSKFDFQGKPYIFYDDHLPLLRRSDCFVARKIWPKADLLYRTFLSSPDAELLGAEPNPAKIDRVFAAAIKRRTGGRSGLVMQSRYPNSGWENGITAEEYSLFHGFSDLFPGFDAWLKKMTDCEVHGHLFARDRVEFASGGDAFDGLLPAAPAVRDYDPTQFLLNLIWNARGTRQCFQFSPRDRQKIMWTIAPDPNAQISVISGAWAIPLSQSDEEFGAHRATAAKLQQIEREWLDLLLSVTTKARVRIWTLAEFLENPMTPLQEILDEIGGHEARQVRTMPDMADLSRIPDFLQQLRNDGMNPYLMGEFPQVRDPEGRTVLRRKPYLVRQ